VSDPVDRLYQLPLDDFVRARNDLAKQLRLAGDREAAKQIKALTKPSVSAWAVNQLYWTARIDFQRLIKAADELRAATGELLGGAGASALAAAREKRRAALNAALERAGDILEAAGHGRSQLTMRRVSTSLEALAAEGGGNAGRLSADIQSAGFGALSGFAAMAAQLPTPPTHHETPAAPAKPPEAPADPPPAAEEAPQDSVQRAEAEAAFEQAQALFEFRSRRTGEVRAAAEQATTRAHAARAELQEAQRRLGKAEQAVEETAEAARAGQAQLDAEVSKLSDAESALEAARQRLSGLD